MTKPTSPAKRGHPAGGNVVFAPSAGIPPAGGRVAAAQRQIGLTLAGLLIAAASWSTSGTSGSMSGGDGPQQPLERGVAASDDRLHDSPSALPGLPGTIPATRLELNGRQVEVVAGVVLVRPVDARLARSSLEALGARVLYISPSGFWRVALPDGAELQSFLQRLQHDPTFDSVQPEGLVRAASDSTSSYRYRGYQWNLDQIHHPEALEEQDEQDSLDDVTLAVIDSGVAYEDRAEGTVVYRKSPDLVGSRIQAGPDYVDGDSHPNDLSGHGTHIANIIASSGGTQGVAPGVTLMPIRVLDGQNAGTELGLVDAVSYAVEQGADIINLSLSFTSGYVPGEALAGAIQHAVDNGVNVFAASGNQGLREVSYPAAYADVVAVGASRLTAEDKAWVADYSNTGTALDLLAPGGVSGLDVNEDGQPDAILAQTIEPGNPSALHYYLVAGTSQATAHASGAAAWLRAAGADADETRQALLGSAEAAWGSHSFLTRLDIGLLRLDTALEYWREGETEEESLAPYYVNLLPLLYSNGDAVGALGYIQVIDRYGMPARKVLVAGHWIGSMPANFAVVTNDEGLATVSGVGEVDAGSAMFGLQVDRVLDRRQRYAPPPTGYYYLSAGLWSAIQVWYEDDRASGSSLLFGVRPGANGMPSWAASSYIARPIGPVDGLAPIALAFTAGWLPGLATFDPANLIEVTASFDQARAFGWGWSTSATLEVADGVALSNGDSIRIGIAPYDPSMFYGGLTLAAPVINASSERFGAENEAFLADLSRDATGARTTPTLIGDGATSTFWTNSTASPTLWGDANTPTLWGWAASPTLWTQSAVGSIWTNGTSPNLWGDGFLSTVLSESMDATATADGSVGTIYGMTAGSSGDVYTVQLGGSSSSVPVMVASSYSDSPSSTPAILGSGGFTPTTDTICVTSDQP